MKHTLQDIIEFTVSLAFNMHKITLIYVTVFLQYLKEPEAYEF